MLTRMLQISCLSMINWEIVLALLSHSGKSLCKQVLLVGCCFSFIRGRFSWVCLQKHIFILVENKFMRLPEFICHLPKFHLLSFCQYTHQHHLPHNLGRIVSHRLYNQCIFFEFEHDVPSFHIVGPR